MMYQTSYNRSTHKRYYETTVLPSLTVPDQTMSIKELIARHVVGLPILGNKVPVYTGEDDIMDGKNPATLDLIDLQEIKIAGEKASRDLREVGEGRARNHRKKLRKSELELEVNRELEKRKNLSTNGDKNA